MSSGVHEQQAAPSSRLAEGKLEIVGLLPHSSNYTFLARVRGADGETLAVYKPRRGEMPLWDFPEGTLCKREVAAYEVARAIGWPPVPPTILRDGPEGIGSVQLFIEHDPRQHYFTLQDQHLDEFRRVAAFDVVINNADRKAGHCLLAEDGVIYLVDHGVSFSVERKLRTVIWEHAGERLPDALCEELTRLTAELRTGPLRARLLELLGEREIAATARRAERLVAAGHFPFPGPGRAYPWPPV
jgi:uncharacterized repeat protein (TIGR03843 family)